MHVHRGKTVCGCSEKRAFCKPKRKVSAETSPADSLILDFQPPDCEETNFCCSSPVCGTWLWQPKQRMTKESCRKSGH